MRDAERSGSQPLTAGRPLAVQAWAVPGGGQDRHEAKQHRPSLRPNDAVDSKTRIALEVPDRLLGGRVEDPAGRERAKALRRKDQLKCPDVRSGRPCAEQPLAELRCFGGTGRSLWWNGAARIGVRGRRREEDQENAEQERPSCDPVGA